jgi:hypothetical protein
MMQVFTSFFLFDLGEGKRGCEYDVNSFGKLCGVGLCSRLWRQRVVMCLVCYVVGMLI